MTNVLRRVSVRGEVPPRRRHARQLIHTFMPDYSVNTDIETAQQRFENVLSGERFKGLKAILDSLSANREALCDKVNSTNSYEELLTKLGYRVNLTKQIHVNDCYARVGPAGGIRAVLAYHDIPSHSSLPTLVHFDSSVTTTPKSSGFFNSCLMALKTQLNAQPAASPRS